MNAQEAAAFVREAVLAQGVPGVTREQLLGWFSRNGRTLEATIGSKLGRWLDPVTTPRTRVTFATIPEWIAGLRELQARPPASKKYEDVRRHLGALTEAVIATGSPEELAELDELLKAPERMGGLRKGRGLRGDDVVTALVDAVDRQRARLGKAARSAEADAPPPTVQTPPDLWTEKQRTAANLAAMRVLAERQGSPEALTDADRRTLAAYSGWGGLSIEKAAPSFPLGIPHPDPRGLIHEYYTPTRVAQEIARVVADRLDGLPRGPDGRIAALEPSAGIGRFVRALWTPDVAWTIVEWSELSATLLRSLLRSPTVSAEVWHGPFERWVRDEAGDRSFGLVLSNPPYGTRGASVTEDPVRAYRERRAYAYFLRRAADLVTAGGLSVFVIPTGFVTGTGADARRLRELVLRRHHLAAAFRLPSSTFPGAMLPTDLVFLRSRGGELAKPEPNDEDIIDGGYFRAHPDHILGREVGDAAEAEEGREGTGKKARFGYQVEGTFERIPDFEERPICQSCDLRAFASASSRTAPRMGGVRTTVEDRLVADLPPTLAEVVRLGLRLDRYLAERSAGTELAVELHHELIEAVQAWLRKNGNPYASLEVQQLAKEGNTGAERFLSVIDKAGKLLPTVAVAPTFQAAYGGGPDDVGAQADFLWRTRRVVHHDELYGFHREQGGRASSETVAEHMRAARWFEDGDAEGRRWVPESVFLTGDLWPRYDRAVAAGRTEDAAALLRVIRPATFEDIDILTPQQKWVPLNLISQWMSETVNRRYGALRLVMKAGLVRPAEVEDYGDTGDVYGLSPEALWCLGWINHDRSLFKPSHRKDQDIDEVRLAYAKEWSTAFQAWIGASAERRAAVEHAYQRTLQGWVAPSYSAEPLSIARWAPQGPRPHPHQTSGARRVLENRGGLVAFDVGVGKTFTALQIVGRARQEGWARRPVVLVPNSIVWKWVNDFKKCLPDYRVGVVGSKLVTISRGPRKNQRTSSIDTPEERGATWSAFQAGEYDVVLLTYSALARTRMNEKAILEYAEQTAAIQRELELRRRNAQEARKPTERQQAILNEGMAAWVAEQMELPEDWSYDPGIAWDDIGVDLFVIDEAQNFKNLYLPEPREGGVPRFMGSAGEGSKRAWQLDFRCAAVRRRTKGNGIVLLSATPAKNSPLEFYNLVQYVNHEVWTERGITDPEGFIDRYCKIEMRDVLDSSLSVVTRSACTGFVNLHELRDVVFRYGEFKTAEEVGLKLPEPKVNLIEVPMDPLQEAKYDHLVGEVEKAMKSKDKKDKAKILGLLARMSLVSIHAQMDEVNVGDVVKDDAGRNVKRVDRAARAAMIRDTDPHSPKFDELAKRVLSAQTCGHIVFLDLLAGHAWVKRVLVENGVPADRIAFLNGEATPAPADRQRIAAEFNGDVEAGIPPKYDVVICNAVAYEGIDLQTRTCAIHHLDLPWEPATLQQRNGRGVRQGNTLATIEINYYFALRSMDGQRFDLIRNKQGWMSALLKSQARDTNNPGAQSDLSPEEILVLISRDPEKTRARLAELRAKRAEETRAKVAEEAVRVARSAQARFRKAERTKDPEEAAVLRGEAEARLGDLARMDPEAWPWAAWAMAMREHHLVVPTHGPPIHEGLRFMVDDATVPGAKVYYEVGRTDDVGSFWLRRAADTAFREEKIELLTATPWVRAQRPEGWPEDEEKLERDMLTRVDTSLKWGNWTAMAWRGAAASFQDRWWPIIEHRVLRMLGQSSSGYERFLPVRSGDGLAVLSRGFPAEVDVIPPTSRGWTEYLARAPLSGLTWRELDQAAVWWWGRHIPQNLLAAAKRAAG